MTHHLLSRVEALIFNVPLCVTPDRAELIASNLAERFGVEPIKEPVARGFLDESEEGAKPYSVSKGIATIAINGELVNRGSWLQSASGMTSYDGLASALRQADGDYQVTGILLDINSPGGEAAGMVETAALIRSTAKPVSAFVNGVAASAAYGLAAAADEIVVAPSARLGSIGVVYLHLDRSAAVAKSGVKPTLIHAGKFKVDGNPLEPLEPEARARIQSAIDDVYGLFTASVGRHRSVLGEAGARKTEAGTFMGQKAVDARLADRVGSLDDVLASLSTRRAKAPGQLNGELSMTAADTNVVAKADHEAALAAEAKKSRETAATAATEASNAARARIQAIISSPEAEGREGQAKALAFDTSLSAEEAVKVLSASHKAPAAAASRTAALTAPAVGADGAGADAAADGAVPWAGIVDDLNKKAKAMNPAFRTN